MAFLIRLEPDERVVLKAIIDVCTGSGGSITKYSALLIHERIDAKDRIQHKLSLDRQMDIFNKLADNHIINVDQIINTEFYGPKPAPGESKPKLYWRNNTEWAKKIFQINGIVPIEQVYAQHKSSLFINMPIEDANRLYNYYFTNHRVSLMFNTGNNRLRIKIDEGGWKNLPTIHEGSVANIIIKNAWANVGKKVSLGKLVESGILDEKYKNKYLSNLLQRNKTIRALHPKLLYQDDDYMIFRKSADYTYDELCELRIKLGI